MPNLTDNELIVLEMFSQSKRPISVKLLPSTLKRSYDRRIDPRNLMLNQIELLPFLFIISLLES